MYKPKIVISSSSSEKEVWPYQQSDSDDIFLREDYDSEHQPFPNASVEQETEEDDEITINGTIHIGIRTTSLFYIVFSDAEELRNEKVLPLDNNNNNRNKY